MGAILELVQQARQFGAEFKVDNRGRIWVKGIESLPKELQHDLRQHREDLLRYLAGGVIWETGNIAQIRSLLVFREAELVVAKTKLTGDSRSDWYINNTILDLEMKIADLRKWLAEALERDNRHRG